ncbi:acyl-coenzyme A thioesterase THEM4 [Microdochium nivale]|nr:acyl-coenzyme A thioesterase THEM4 [Microdochium nivale]
MSDSKHSPLPPPPSLPPDLSRPAPRGSRQAGHVSDVAYLLSRPECQARLTRPGTKLWDASSSGYLGHTLKTDNQIMAYTYFWHDDDEQPQSSSTPTSTSPPPPPPPHIVDLPCGSPHGGAATFSAAAEDPTISPDSTLYALVATGPGFQSYPGVMHGGAVATLLDECNGQTNVWNRVRGVPGFVGRGFMTGSLTTKFLRPVPTPAVLLVSMRVVGHEVEKGKVWIKGEIRPLLEDGSEGEVCATGESLWRALRGGAEMLDKPKI